MSGYGITGIGYPLGNIGLGATGTYGSYDAYMPSTLGMYGMNGLGAYGTMGMGSSIFNGMGGMYNPMFMGNMYQQMQQQMELSQLAHAGKMHTGLYANEVAAHRTTDSALISKVLTNADVQQGVTNLYKKVQEGDQDGICRTFDDLKNYIMNTYRDELAARGDKINPQTSATEIIERVYGTIISAKQGGVPANLRDDIERFGDGSFANGFMKGFRKGHHERYVDETMMHCFGLPVDQFESKEMRQDIGKGVGVAANILEKGVYGGAAGFGLATIGSGLTKGVASIFGKGEKIPFMNTKGWWKGSGRFAFATAIAAAIAAGVWQLSDS